MSRIVIRIICAAQRRLWTVPVSLFSCDEAQEIGEAKLRKELAHER